ncbi:MFS general substrate transporter [Aspergillus heteromorphus CBS 117.55]|uniref:MFS general substrate transporter n=1 Tax=Aspergillus heteromorphus CBS 117.55 TaxID=1448321 RepID=A0A317WUB1_9EURO|nr:MFS general substrate transporter [Aspergillus heteromorphus CBS 117.55]PWY89946.1 MFS general substrate transporter [Aspergillus heteromorphus CBS 117.55]
MADQQIDEISVIEHPTATKAACLPEQRAKLKDVGVDTGSLPESPSNVVESFEVSEDPNSPPKGRSKLRTFSIMIMLCLVLFISALDQTIVSTAIPSMTKDLHSAAGYTWIGAAYLLSMCATNPMWVRISDIWGRKHGLLGAIIVFSIGSTIAAASTSMPMLIAGRGVQGLAGGGITSLVSIIISDLFSMRHRALYISATALVWVLAGTTGPVIGGALSEYATWRWCFWINLPICGLSFFILLFFLDLHNPRTKLGDGLKAIDWLGTVSILTIILLLLLGLDFGGVTFVWNSPTVICMIVFGSVLIGFFLFAEKRLARYPLMDLGVFKGWSNNAVILIAAAHSMATRGSEYYLPFYFQSVKQASPTKSGVLIIPMMAAASLSDVAVGILIHQTGRYREIIWAGTTLLTLGTGLYIMLGVDTSLGQIIGFEIVGGIGLSLLLSTPMLAIQNNVNQADVAVATSTLGFARSIATSLSIVLGGIVFQDSMSSQRSSLVAVGLNESYLAAFSGDEAAANVEMVASIEDPVQHRAVQSAYAWSIRNMFIMYTAVAAVGLLASPFVKQRHMSSEHTETKTGIANMTDRKRKTGD